MLGRDAALPSQLRASSEILRESESSGVAEVPLRRKPPVRRRLPVDERQELRNADLASWKDNYLANMAEARETKSHHQAPFLAKKNAAFWVFGSGIGSVGAGLGSSKLSGPLGMFAGDAFMEALTGTKLTTSRKRSRGDEEDQGSDSEARRIRLRDEDGDQFGRGDQNMLQDDDPLVLRSEDVST